LVRERQTAVRIRRLLNEGEETTPGVGRIERTLLDEVSPSHSGNHRRAVHAATQCCGHSCPVDRSTQELSGGNADLMQDLGAELCFENKDATRVQATQLLRSCRAEVQTRLIPQPMVIDEVHQLVY